MDQVFHLVYFSYASESLSYSDIRNILISSRKNNARDNITGVLIFREGFFIQVLEGNEEKVRNLVNVIRLDNRNHTLKVLIQDNSEKRQFGDWSMAFLDGDLSSNATKDLLEFFEACVDSTTDRKSLIMPLVRQLRSSAPDFQ